MVKYYDDYDNSSDNDSIDENEITIIDVDTTIRNLEEQLGEIYDNVIVEFEERIMGLEHDNPIMMKSYFIEYMKRECELYNLLESAKEIILKN